MRKITLALLSIAVFLIGCNYQSINKKLIAVDSLIVAEEYDSAYQIMSMVNLSSLHTKEDLAHYNLVKIQMSFLINKPALSDNIGDLINETMNYYQNSSDKVKFTDTYYYKAMWAYRNTQVDEAVLLLKKAEELARESGSLWHQYKIFTMLSFINGLCGNYDVQLQYAKKALEYSKRIGSKKTIPNAYFRLATAYSYLGIEDSAKLCINATVPYIKYVPANDLPYFLANIGYLYKKTDSKLSKEYFQKSLEYKELSETLAHLADIYYDEGNKEEAYRLWKRALAADDQAPKDNIIHNLIEYDIENGRIDSISDRVNEIIAIRDSIDENLLNSSTRDLQLKFDHEVEMHQLDKTMGHWRTGAFILITLTLLLAIYILRKNHLNKLREQKQQIKWQEHEQLIQEQQLQMNDFLNQIEELKATGENREKEIENLNHQIKEFSKSMEPELQNGFARYVEIKSGGNLSGWKDKDIKDFNTYYAAIDFWTVYRLRKVKREESLTDHRLFYLILKHLDKSDSEIMRIMGIGPDTLRSYRKRTKPTR